MPRIGRPVCGEKDRPARPPAALDTRHLSEAMEDRAGTKSAGDGGAMSRNHLPPYWCRPRAGPRDLGPATTGGDKDNSDEEDDPQHRGDAIPVHGGHPGHSGTLAQATVLSLWTWKQTCQGVPAMNLAGVCSAETEFHGRARSGPSDPRPSATAPDLETPLAQRSWIAPEQAQDSPAQSAVRSSSGAVERLAAKRMVVCPRY